ncbi:MAG TPA: amino acid adenylation domain-containing protein, partial [Thermoanaerobaculia bacterium]|nr:amino acid adenylation domain-containing protein [Thermoanaerobaculia bacterium]
DLPGVRLSPLGAAIETAKFDLSLSLIEEGGQVVGGLSYNTDLFDAATADRLLGHFATLLAGLCQEPERSVSGASLLSDGERSQLLWEWNDTGAGVQGEVLVHELFERQAAAHPEAVALVYEDEQIRYGELDRRAERLARRLRRLGVGPDSRVALLLSRSAEVVVALLGVLKAGGAYVPLDPKLPGERLALLLEEVGARVLVLEEGLRDLLPASAPALERVFLDDLQPTEESWQPAPRSTPGSLAYVLFTSGSTGRPKGVAIGHRQLANYVLGAMERLRLPAGSSFATVSSFAADLGNTSVFPALCGGGCLHVISEARLGDPDALGAYVRRWGVDCLKIVPSHLKALLSGADPAAVLPRRLLVLGGEASDWSLVRQVRELAPGCRVLNHYGPTETTVGVLTLPAEPVAGQTGAVPLGRPLPGSRIYVVDRRLTPVPVGVAGELVVGGAGVGRGYLGRPELTAERFVPDPFWNPVDPSDPTDPTDLHLGGRLYRTGDLARRLADGRVEFLGRTDDQVKIRGFRVEPGEVEAVLRGLPGVREAVVLARPDAGGQRRLVAWVVGEALDPLELRRGLLARLPEYMVPPAIVVLESLPLTPNGKIDRKALPEPEAQAAESAELLAPRTPAEEVLAAIWGEVLGIDRLGVDQSFFALGGHSLLATQVISRIRRAFAVELPLRDLFEAPTIAELAGRIEQARRAGWGALAPAIVPVPRTGALRLSFAQQRLWFLDRLEPDSPAYNIPVALRVEGRLRVDVLARALSEVMRRHEALRTTFGEVDGEPVQVIAAAGALSLPVVDLAGLPQALREAEASRRIGEEALRPFDLAQGPLLRAALLRLDAEEHAALLTLHHIVSDGWSRSVLVEEIGALYAAFLDEGLEDGPSPLPELPVQYADYAEWQRSWLSGEVLEAELGYWRGRLAGLPPRLELPTDRPRPAVQTHRGAAQAVALSPELSARLSALGRREGATPFMTLLAGWQALLGRYAGSEDLAVGTPIAGRNREETEKLIGFFVNTLVLRGDLSGGPSFQELLGRVRQASLEAHEHQEIPFERLVEELAPERSLSNSPLFQVLFVLQNVPRRALDLPGLRLSPLGAEVEVAKFDLSLGLMEEGGQVFGSLSYNTDLF